MFFSNANMCEYLEVCLRICWYVAPSISWDSLKNRILSDIELFKQLNTFECT